MPPKSVNDTHSYTAVLENETLEDLLGASRTLGYPLFLKVMGFSSPDFGAVPEVHTLAYFAAILVFWAASSAYAGSSWLAFAFSAPLVFVDLFKIVNRVQPDFLSCALAVAALGFLVWAAARPQRTVYLWGVAIFVFFSYQTRPAYLFFLGFVPLIGVVLWLCRWGLDWRRMVRWMVGVGVATLLPFVMYASLRWAVVGHFGLVSYGGVNAIGIAATLLDSDVVERLPAEVKPYGKRIYRKLRMGHDRVPPYPAKLGGAAFRYNRIVWKHCFPMAVEYLESESGEPPSLVEINKLLTDTSKAIFRLAPRSYAEWILSSFARTTRRVIQAPWIRIPGLILMVSAAVVGIWWLILVRGGRLRERVGVAQTVASLGPTFGLVVLGVGYYICHVLLIVAVEIPIPRYTVTTTLFLPGSAIGLLFGVWQQVAIGVSARSNSRA